MSCLNVAHGLFACNHHSTLAVPTMVIFYSFKTFQNPVALWQSFASCTFDSHEAVRICRFLFSMLHTMKLSHLKSVLINGTFIPITCICRKESRNLPRECYPVPLLIHSPAGLQDLVSTGQDTAEVI